MTGRVLFVDDEPNLLAGLRRMLHGMRREWDMLFAVSAREALEILDRERIDVVVTDMRMPDLGGGDLLRLVSQRHPEVIRVVLTGQADKATVIRSLGPAHQYLSKPCDAESLKTTLSRAFALRGLLSDEDLSRAISSLESLPSLPSVYAELMDALDSPDASLNAVGEMMSRDAAVCAKLLQLVNSAFFGLPVRVSSPQKAVNLLGLELVKALVLTVSIHSFYEHSGIRSESIRALLDHGLRTGMLARRIAENCRGGGESVASPFVAGLLHDVGKLILMHLVPERYSDVMRLAESEHCTDWEAERRLLGTTHGPIGGYLLGIWGLPDAIVRAVAYHHLPGRCPVGDLSDLTLVHIADALEHAAAGQERMAARLDFEYLCKCGVADRIEEWRLGCAEDAGRKQ